MEDSCRDDLRCRPVEIHGCDRMGGDSITRTLPVLTGRGNLVRNYPHVEGVDFAGRVKESRDRRYPSGTAGDSHRLACRRAALGRFFAICGARRSGLAGAAPQAHCRRAKRWCSAPPGSTAMLAINRLKSRWAEDRWRRGAGDRGRRRRWFDRRAAARAARARGRGGKRPGRNWRRRLVRLGAARVVGREAVIPAIRTRASTRRIVGHDADRQTSAETMLAELLKKIVPKARASLRSATPAASPSRAACCRSSCAITLVRHRQRAAILTRRRRPRGTGSRHCFRPLCMRRG